MKKLKSLLLGSVLGALGFAQTLQAAEQMPNGTWVDARSFQSPTGARLVVTYFASEMSGKVMICGAFYADRGVRLGFGNGIGRYSFYLNGAEIISHGRFLPRVATEADLPRSIGCMRTEIPYTNGVNDHIVGQYN